MRREDARRLLRKVLVLTVLLGGLFFLTHPAHEVVYATDCQQCSETYHDCLLSCNGSQTCEQTCVQNNNTCFNFCTSEGGGSSGGGVVTTHCQTRNECCNGCIATRSACWANDPDFEDLMIDACMATGRTRIQCCNISYQECVNQCP